MNIPENLSALRNEMSAKGIDAYIIPSSDPHNSEYASARWQSRKWISGFTGSAGTVVVTLTQAILWADGRYHIQAAKEVAGTGIEVFKVGLPDVPTLEEWLADTLAEKAVVGFDGTVITGSFAAKLLEKFDYKKISLNGDHDLIEAIWNDRPSLPADPIFEHEVKFAGQSRLEKISSIRKQMAEVNADFFLLSSLDDIAWLFNLRGTDVPCCPLFLSYCLISQHDAWLCVDSSKIPLPLQEVLQKDNIQLDAYDSIYAKVSNIAADSTIFYNPAVVNYKLEQCIPATCRTVKNTNFTTHAKAIKNATEISNYKNCFVRDGVYMVKFIKWLEDSLGTTVVTEKSASDYLESLRRQDEYFRGLSFTTIPGYKEHGAMMHYSVSEESDVELKPESFFLVDSGGLYLDGTTDITRTFALGSLTEQEKEDYTLTLKGHIKLAMAVFLHGTRGIQLDILARSSMWEKSINYRCGTGHGVGFFLNVHEGPHNISPGFLDEKLLPGMVVTNEPGVYREGKHGVRVENIMLVIEADESEFGKFYKFEPMTLCPIDTRALLPDLMTEDEIEWLDSYHRLVFEKLAPHLSESHKSFLKEKTQPLLKAQKTY